MADIRRQVLEDYVKQLITEELRLDKCSDGPQRKAEDRKKGRPEERWGVQGINPVIKPAIK